LPVAVPGAAVSPGTSTWSLVNAPGITEKAALVPRANVGGSFVWVAVRRTSVSAFE